MPPNAPRRLNAAAGQCLFILVLIGPIGVLANLVIAATMIASSHIEPPAIGAMILVNVGIALYLLPALIAVLRRHRQPLAIFLLNLVLGWTVLGWIAALVWACVNDTE